MPTAMTFVLRRLFSTPFFTRDPTREGALQTIAWWELRRIPFNLIVGAAGLASMVITLVAIVVAAATQGSADESMDGAFFWMFLVIAYGVMANVCFTFGWIVELCLVRRIWPEEGRHFGPISFSLGLAFSVLLTISPAVLMTMVAVLMLISAAVKHS